MSDPASMPVPALAPLPKTRLPEDLTARAKAKAAEPAAAPEVVAPVKRGPGKKLVLLVPLAFLPVGYVGSQWVRASPPGAAAHAAEPAPPHDTIDEAILDDQFEAALSRARAGQKGASGEVRSALRFREALCLEALAQVAEAAEVYASLGDAAADTPRGVAARLGQAGCLIQAGRIADARRVVAALVLTSGRLPADPELLAEIHLAKAALELGQVPAPPKPHPFQPAGLARSPRRPEYERFLRWAGPLANEHAHGERNPVRGPMVTAAVSDPLRGPARPIEHASAENEHAPKHDAHEAHPPGERNPVRGPMVTAAVSDPLRGSARPVEHPLTVAAGPAVLERLVRGRATAPDVAAAIAEVATAAGLAVRTDPGVADRLAGRVAAVHVHEAWLADVLDALTEPYEIAWRVEAGAVVLAPEADDPGRRRDRARRSISMALAAAPAHPWRPAFLIDLGNLDFADGKWRAAAGWYARMVADDPNRPEAAHAAYNLGLTHLRLGDRAKAREHFMGVVDRDPGGKWAGLAYGWIGRSHLDADAPQPARRAFEKALAASPSTATGPAAVLGMCLADFQLGEYEAGLAALKPFKARLKQDEFKPTTAFLDAYGRYRLAARPKRTGEEEDLLYAVLNLGDDPLLGPALMYVVGQACREFGFGPRMQALYEKTLPDFRGPLAVRMVLGLAEYHLEAGDRAMARERFLVAAAADRGASGRQARVRLAELALSAGRPAEALGHAREALGDGADRATALKLMGQAYEGQRDFGRAATCFAGDVPE